jgi:hypothetical protein
MKVNVARSYYVIAKIGNRNSGGDLTMVPIGNFEDPSLFDEHDRALDGIGRGKQLSSSESQHRNVLIAAKRANRTTMINTATTKIVAA